jgi:hypothetical protein
MNFFISYLPSSFFLLLTIQISPNFSVFKKDKFDSLFSITSNKLFFNFSAGVIHPTANTIIKIVTSGFIFIFPFPALHLISHLFQFL